jgi:hypothetical protein
VLPRNSKGKQASSIARVVVLACLLATPILAACSSDATSPAARFDGWWFGPFSSGQNTFRVLEFQLALNGQSVTGHGLDRSTSNPAVVVSHFVVTGNLVGDTLSLSIAGWNNDGDTTCCVTFRGVFLQGYDPQGYVGELHVRQQRRTSDLEMDVQRMTKDYQFYLSPR